MSVNKLKAALAWPFTHEPALVFAVVAAVVGLVNAKWGLHLDAVQVITWIGTALGVGVLTRQTVVSPATHAKRVHHAESVGYRKGHTASQSASYRVGGGVPGPGSTELAAGEVVVSPAQRVQPPVPPVPPQV